MRSVERLSDVLWLHSYVGSHGIPQLSSLSAVLSLVGLRELEGGAFLSVARPGCGWVRLLTKTLGRRDVKGA